MPTDEEMPAHAHQLWEKRVSRMGESTSSGARQNGSCIATKLIPIRRKDLSVNLRPSTFPLSGHCLERARLSLI